MPTPTYEAIASVTLSSNTSTVTFSSIPQTYADLVFSISCWNSTSGGVFRMQWNGSSDAHITAGISGVSGGRQSFTRNTNYFEFNAGSPTWTNDSSAYQISINDYSNTTKYPSWSGAGGGGDNQYETSILTGLLGGTERAVTSVSFFFSTGSFVAGSTFNLWGIHA